jgi:hypothetical protein
MALKATSYMDSTVLHNVAQGRKAAERTNALLVALLEKQDRTNYLLHIIANNSAQALDRLEGK